MNKYFFKIQIYSLLLLACIILFNCQIKAEPLNDSSFEKKVALVGNINLVKTQGSNEYASIDDAIQDKEGNLWFATTGEGVYRYDGKNFIQFTEKDGLGSNYVFCIITDNADNIWFGTADGASYYDGKKFTHIPITAIKENYTSYQKTKPDIYGVPTPYENYVWSMLKDKTGIIWLGTWDGVYRYDGKNFTQFVQYGGILDNMGVQLRGIESMLEDNTGKIWFGGRKTVGVYCYDGKQIINMKVNSKDWLMPEMIDKDGNIWFWGSGLPFKYDGKTFTSFPVKTFSDWVFEIGEDKDRNIWFGYLGKGVYRYDGKNFNYFGLKDGFDKVGVSCILTDKEGNIWFGTKNVGLVKYDGKKFTNFSE